MKQIQSLVFGGFAVNMIAFAVVAGLNVSRNVQSTTALTARQSALNNIAKHVLSDSCWRYRSRHKLKIGDPVVTKGTATGKIPTSCIYSPSTKQFAEVGYLDSELQVLRVFSIKEVKSAKSQLKGNNN